MPEKNLPAPKNNEIKVEKTFKLNHPKIKYKYFPVF